MLSISIQRHSILLCPCQAWSLGQGRSGSPPQRSSLPLQQMIPVFCFLLLLFPFTSLLFFWITAWTLAFFKIQFNPVIITNYQYYLWCLNFPFVTCESPSLCISCYLFFFLIFIYLAVLGCSFSLWDLVPWPGIEPRPLHWDQPSLSPWKPGKSPSYRLIYLWTLSCFLT